MVHLTRLTKRTEICNALTLVVVASTECPSGDIAVHVWLTFAGVVGSLTHRFDSLKIRSKRSVVILIHINAKIFYLLLIIIEYSNKIKSN